MARSNEPIAWAPFSAGMMLDAMVVPAIVVITGVLVPLGLVSEETLASLLSHILGRAFVFAVVALSLFHAGHRLRFALADLGLSHMRGLLAVVMYGGAIVGSALAAVACFGGGETCAWLLGICGVG